ncbi:hypothetical protein DW352_02735 [Pseudolabrys taiwanensis]|uniref:Uncharacterized protein n=1 Tax=Pseudolabrys taiwanensis TaxID=331696 RepID=A0A345ZRI1_9HYPH|nr:hypothetical protein [Pseudolabrys taiwanensis]AXK79528.1 hypothetical protein DW352_02735 [Pseudolabrys taiwanensis]
MRMASAVLCLLSILIAACPTIAAELGRSFDSYRDLHRDTQYGSVLFNEGSIRLRESRSKKRFREIVGSGEIRLPSQEGYCFVINHYDSPNGKNGSDQKYRAKISKEFADGRTTEEPLERTFSPTDELVSANLPDLCVAGIVNASKVTIAFSSDDGYFDRTIFFSLK